MNGLVILLLFRHKTVHVLLTLGAVGPAIAPTTRTNLGLDTQAAIATR